jgi:hypothetical protein
LGYFALGYECYGTIHKSRATPLWIFNTYWKEIVIWVVSLLLFAIIGTIKSDKLACKYQRERIAKK